MATGPRVVIGRKGTLGSIHYVASDLWPHDTTLWSKDLNGNNPRFVYYFLHTINFKRFDVGNSNPTLNRNHIHDLPVRIPPLSVQGEITRILSAYDDLIENNARRIKLLENAARLLYEEWFVRLRFPGHEDVKVKDGVPEGGNNCHLCRTAKLGVEAHRARSNDSWTAPFHGTRLPMQLVRQACLSSAQRNMLPKSGPKKVYF